MTEADPPAEESQVSRLSRFGCGCLVACALLAAGAAGVVWVIRSSELDVSPNGARIFRHPNMGDVHALQVEDSQMVVVSARGSVYEETKSSFRRLVINGNVVDPYVPTSIGKGRVIALAGSDSKLNTIELPGSGTRTPLPKGLRAIATASDEGRVAVLYQDGSADVSGGGFSAHRLGALQASFVSLGGGRTALGGEEGIEVYGPKGTRLKSFGGDGPYGLTAMRLSPSGSLLAAARTNDKVEIWKVETGEQSALFPAGNDFDIVALAFSPSENMLGVGTTQGLFEVWRLDNLSNPERFPLNLSEGKAMVPGRVTSIAISDYRYLWAIEDRVYEIIYSFPQN